MPGPINRHIAEFEKNTLCYLIFKVIFSRLDRVFVRNSLFCSKLLFYAVREVFFDENSIIFGAFWSKMPNFEGLKFNRHLGINRHFAKNSKNRGVC